MAKSKAHSEIFVFVLFFKKETHTSLQEKAVVDAHGILSIVKEMPAEHVEKCKTVFRRKACHYHQFTKDFTRGNKEGSLQTSQRFDST